MEEGEDDQEETKENEEGEAEEEEDEKEGSEGEQENDENSITTQEKMIVDVLHEIGENMAPKVNEEREILEPKKKDTNKNYGEESNPTDIPLSSVLEENPFLQPGEKGKMETFGNQNLNKDKVDHYNSIDIVQSVKAMHMYSYKFDKQMVEEIKKLSNRMQNLHKRRDEEGKSQPTKRIKQRQIMNIRQLWRFSYNISMRGLKKNEAIFRGILLHNHEALKPSMINLKGMNAFLQGLKVKEIVNVDKDEGTYNQD